MNATTDLIIATFPYLGTVYVTDGDIQTGTVFKIEGGVRTQAAWPEWAVQNKPGYCIDNACSHIAAGVVRCVDDTNYPERVKIMTAPNGVKFAV